MNIKLEKLDGNMAKITIEAAAEKFAAAVDRAYNKSKGKIALPGFRKGKAPRMMIEKMYGEGFFFEDAANILVPEAYDEAMDSEELKDVEITSRPEIEITQIEKDKPFIFTAVVALKPEVELGKYKGFRLARKKAEITEEEVNKEIDRIREQNSRMVTVDDRAVEDGDIAVIDYEGFKDGVPFEGGKAENHELLIGSHSFIDTFEEQLIGKNIGDECEVNVTFPEEYHAENLKGAKAVFKVKINGIKKKELPELDDEFASEVSDFETLEEYKADVLKKLTEKKQEELNNTRRNDILKKAVDNAKMIIPDAMIDFQARQLVNNYAQQLQVQGLSFETYMQYTGQTIESMVEQMKEQAKARIQNSLVLEAIAAAEKVEVTEEDMDNEIEQMAKSYQMESEKIKELLSDAEKENIKKDLEAKKAFDLIAK